MLNNLVAGYRLSVDPNQGLRGQATQSEQFVVFVERINMSTRPAHSVREVLNTVTAPDNPDTLRWFLKG